MNNCLNECIEMVTKEKPIVVKEINPLLLGKPLVTKEETHCCQGNKPLVARVINK